MGEGQYAQSYGYDPATGNLASKSDVGAYSYSPAKPHAVTSAGAMNYQYDANGNMVSRNGEPISYDAENRLTAFAGKTWLYDGDGKRVAEINADGTATIFIGNYFEGAYPEPEPPAQPPQPNKVYLPIVLKGGVSFEPIAPRMGTLYFYADGQRIAMKKDGAVYYLYGDQLGSVSAVADANGSQISRTLYHPWGTSRYLEGASPTDYAYTGQMQEGDIYFYNARWYDPQLGRFMQADTFVPTSQGTQGFDRFAYVNNNPINSSDPSGHCIGFLFSICLGVLTENALVQFYVQNNSNLNNQVRDKIGGNLVTSLSDVITSESARTGISSELIGSIIRHESGAFERRLFFNGLMADTAEFGEATIRSLFKKGSASIGIGQMQVTLAISLEKMGYVDPKGGGTIINLLNHKKTVGYIAGNLKYLQDNLSKDFGPEFTSLPKDIRNRLLLIGYNVGYQELKKNLIERSAYDYVIRESYDNQTLDRYRSWRIR